ncbi:hypothetical protein FNF29_06676 [Cafeteria roenbergensis]|uniref:Neurotransmitter-gated ion-channel ligand-binding domain-containing protein n=1 Tax=Cafeteria roenbergensis TaxID=33653 RepID=A0A5A8C6K6_CAFRO|nr:hypothetical protein FNF29_06676 [Cafeteria roenbergensis]|eukprot:KAA0148458.1 hypothetical protein FNF29_06676 [Cafeteria roenbergensis]
MMVAMQVEGNGPAGAAQRAREAQRLPTITGWTRLLLLDVRDVDLEAQTFVADVDIQVRCPGLRARLSALYGADACSEALGSWPMQWRLDQRLWIRNAVEEVSTERWFDVSKEAFRLRFVGKLSARCRHEDFPVDAFKLPVEVSLTVPVHQVQLELEDSRVLLRLDAPVRSLLDVSPVMVHSVCHSDPDESASRVEYPVLTALLAVRRKSAFFVWNSIVPALFMTALAGCAACLAVESIDPRLDLALALLMALVGFKQGQKTQLPVLPYNTLLDVSVIVQYVGLVAACLISILSLMRACNPLSAASLVGWHVALAGPCAAADVFSSLTGWHGCEERGWGLPHDGSTSSPSHPFPRDAALTDPGCDNIAQASRTDGLLWVMWGAVMVGAHLHILLSAIMSRAATLLAPEWALMKLCRTHQADVEALVAASRPDEEADPATLTPVPSQAVARPDRSGCATPLPCSVLRCRETSAVDSELAAMTAEMGLREALNRLRRQSDGNALAAAEPRAHQEGARIGGTPAPPPPPCRSSVSRAQLQQQRGINQCRLCNTVCCWLACQRYDVDDMLDDLAMLVNVVRVPHVSRHGGQQGLDSAATGCICGGPQRKAAAAPEAPLLARLLCMSDAHITRLHARWAYSVPIRTPLFALAGCVEELALAIGRPVREAALVERQRP